MIPCRGGGSRLGYPKIKKKIGTRLVFFILFLLLLSLPAAAVDTIDVNGTFDLASNATLNQVSNTTENQTVSQSIASAIKAAKPGSAIVIESGEWEGNIVIDKPISLIGMDTGTGRPQIVTKSGLAGVVVAADNVSIAGFVISGDADSAVWIEGNSTSISNNMIVATPIGISAVYGSDISITENTILNHSVGIYAGKNVSGIVSMNNFEDLVDAKSLTTGINWSSVNSTYIYNKSTHNSSLGNYWEGYKGVDTDGNGIGSTPYTPSESASDIRNALGSEFLNSLSDEGSGQIYEGYWTGLFEDVNYVKDYYPLIYDNSNYIVVSSSAGTGGTNETTNNTTNVTSMATETSGEETPHGITPYLDEENIGFPFENPFNQTLLYPQETNTLPEGSPETYLQHPFEIVAVMILIAGVFSGIIGIFGRTGRFYSLWSVKRHEIEFLAGAFISMSLALLYALVSYTSRLIYRVADYGSVQVIFIFATAYLITSSIFLALGLLRGNLSLTLYRLHGPAAVVSTLLFVTSIYSVPVELGPVTGLVYPASLLLSIVLPVIFRLRFDPVFKRWSVENGDTMVTSLDPDSTSLFMKEGDIMNSSLSSSYFPESLHDRYGNVEFIGKGGIARVFKAKRRKDGRVVAVKVPINFDETTGRLFLKEMRIWEGLEHKNIARLYSVNIFPVPYVEMEYLKTPLASVEKPLSPKESLKIICEVAEGLGYAHSMGIIHRDIKPQNIMLAEDGTAKITDWGLGRIMSDGNETTIVGFSLNYAAPEQVAPKTFGRADERTDIYQLGIVFYELITGKKPFSGSGVAEVTDEILHMEPVAPSAAGALTDIFDHVIMKSLMKDPDSRFSSVEEFKSALKEASRFMKDF